MSSPTYLMSANKLLHATREVPAREQWRRID
jgi:hypothetical protein